MQQSIDFHRVRTLVGRELRDSLRDWRIVIPIFILTAIFPFLMNFTAQFMFDFLESYDATIIGERLVPFGMMIVGFFPITFSLVIALETFVGEKERNSLEALLATPASDLELYVGKLLAALLLPLMASYVGIAVYMASMSLSELATLPSMLIVQILLLTTLEGLVMVSGAVIVSAHTTSVRAANLLASFIIIPAALLIQFEAVLMFWATYDALWYIALGLVVVDLILIRVGIRTFNREEILSRELDALNVRRIKQITGRLWVAPPEQAKRALRTEEPLAPWSLKRVYTHDLPALLRSAKLALALALVVLLASFVFGWMIAVEFPFPERFSDMEGMASRATREALGETASNLGNMLVPRFEPLTILYHNLRSLMLSLLIAIFSFGALSLLLMGLPITIIGFLAGQISGAGNNVWLFLGAFVLPHGLIEIPATMLATAFAIRIGAMLINPPQRFTAGEALLLGLTDFCKVFFFLVLPLMALAAVLEVYLTPAVIQMVY